MNLTLETTIDPAELAKALRLLNNAKLSRQWLNDFIGELDTDSYCYIEAWIKDNQVDHVLCGCGRRTFFSKTHSQCEYCRRDLPNAKADLAPASGAQVQRLVGQTEPQETK